MPRTPPAFCRMRSELLHARPARRAPRRDRRCTRSAPPGAAAGTAVLVESIALDDAAGHAARLQERHQPRAHQRGLADSRFAEEERRGALAGQQLGEVGHLALAAEEERAIGLGERHQRLERPEVARARNEQARRTGRAAVERSRWPRRIIRRPVGVSKPGAPANLRAAHALWRAELARGRARDLAGDPRGAATAFARAHALAPAQPEPPFALARARGAPRPPARGRAALSRGARRRDPTGRWRRCRWRASSWRARSRRSPPPSPRRAACSRRRAPRIPTHVLLAVVEAELLLEEERADEAKALLLAARATPAAPRVVELALARAENRIGIAPGVEPVAATRRRSPSSAPATSIAAGRRRAPTWAPCGSGSAASAPRSSSTAARSPLDPRHALAQLQPGDAPARARRSRRARRAPSPPRLAPIRRIRRRARRAGAGPGRARRRDPRHRAPRRGAAPGPRQRGHATQPGEARCPRRPAGRGGVHRAGARRGLRRRCATCASDGAPGGSSRRRRCCSAQGNSDAAGGVQVVCAAFVVALRCLVAPSSCSPAASATRGAIFVQPHYADGADGPARASGADVLDAAKKDDRDRVHDLMATTLLSDAEHDAACSAPRPTPLLPRYHMLMGNLINRGAVELVANVYEHKYDAVDAFAADDPTVAAALVEPHALFAGARAQDERRARAALRRLLRPRRHLEDGEPARQVHRRRRAHAAAVGHDDARAARRRRALSSARRARLEELAHVVEVPRDLHLVVEHRAHDALLVDRRT